MKLMEFLAIREIIMVWGGYLLREIAARNKDFLLAKILKPEPTYLGEAIPVSGDGWLTNDK